ncbi:MAG: type IV pilin [Haloferacaceae archaeon]
MTRTPSDDGRGVSSAVGIVLLVAVVVMLAALFGTMLTGFALPDRTPTNLAYDVTYVADGAGNADRPYVDVTITGGRERVGDDVYVVDGEGHAVQWSTVWTGGPYVESGETLRLDGYGTDGALDHACHDEVYRVVRRSADGSSELLIRARIHGHATGAAAASC